MLPTSHFEPINAPLVACQGEDEDHPLTEWQMDERRMPRTRSADELEMQVLLDRHWTPSGVHRIRLSNALCSCAAFSGALDL